MLNPIITKKNYINFDKAQVFSPSSRYMLDVNIKEYKMSHWIFAPRLKDLTNNIVLFDLFDSPWSIESEVSWTVEESCVLRVRRYPGDHTPCFYTLAIDCSNRNFSIDSGAAIELGKLKDTLEDYYKRDKRKLTKI